VTCGPPSQSRNLLRRASADDTTRNRTWRLHRASPLILATRYTVALIITSAIAPACCRSPSRANSHHHCSQYVSRQPRTCLLAHAERLQSSPWIDINTSLQDARQHCAGSATRRLPLFSHTRRANTTKALSPPDTARSRATRHNGTEAEGGAMACIPH
jgi:hypothetical protein